LSFNLGRKDFFIKKYKEKCHHSVSFEKGNSIYGSF